VQGIDHDGVAAADARDAAGQADLVADRVLLGAGADAAAMIGAAGDGVDLLVQRAAEGDVEFLQPPADRQHRQAGGNRGADQRQRHGIAPRILGRTLRMRRATVERGLDVGTAAGQDDAVQAGHQGRDIRPLPVRGDQDGHGAHHEVGGADIGVGSGVVRHPVDAERLDAAGNPDQRLHDGEYCPPSWQKHEALFRSAAWMKARARP
jgi:hypothetical protein